MGKTIATEVCGVYGRLHSDLESWSICSRISLSLKYVCQLLSGLGFRG